MSLNYLRRDVIDLIDDLRIGQHEQLYTEIHEQIPNVLKKGKEVGRNTKINSELLTKDELLKLKKIILSINK